MAMAGAHFFENFENFQKWADRHFENFQKNGIFLTQIWVFKFGSPQI